MWREGDSQFGIDFRVRLCNPLMDVLALLLESGPRTLSAAPEAKS